MMQYVIIAALIAFIWFFYIKKKPNKSNAETQSKNRKKTKAQADEMIECATCGVYCSLEESILSNAKYYCCDECVQKAR